MLLIDQTDVLFTGSNLLILHRVIITMLWLPHLLGMTRSYLDKVSPLLFTVCELIASAHYNQKQFCSPSYSQECKFNMFPLYLLLILLKSQLPSYLHMIIT